jgi:hypothetical protein
MRLRQQQAGMSIWGMLLIAIMVGFYVLCAVKLIPVYTEYLSVKEILTKVANEHQPGTTTTGQMRRRLDNLFNTNQIYGLKPSEVEIYRKGGKTFIDGNYEGRVTIAGQLDVVLRFDDLLLVAGQPNIK